MGQGNDFQDNTNLPQDGGSPFSADLNSDFTSNFGGSNTSAVSQIFKEGGFVGENKSRLIGLVALVVVLLVGAYVFLGTDDDYGDEEFVIAEDEDSLDETDEMDELGEDEMELEDDEVISDVSDEQLDVPQSAPIQESIDYVDSSDSSEPSSYMPAATVAPSIVSPADGSVRSYDETMVPPEFVWEGSPGGWLVLSKDPSMNSVTTRRRVSGNSHRLRKLVPGTWYWQVINGAGKSGVRSVVITEATRRALSIAEPTEGGSLTGTGGQVSWTGDNKVSFYRVEISSNGWASPAYRFATTGTQMQVQDVAPGQYQLRIGGFSEVSGRWEYSQPVNISVQ